MCGAGFETEQGLRRSMQGLGRGKVWDGQGLGRAGFGTEQSLGAGRWTKGGEKLATYRNSIFFIPYCFFPPYWRFHGGIAIQIQSTVQIVENPDIGQQLLVSFRGSQKIRIHLSLKIINLSKTYHHARGLNQGCPRLNETNPNSSLAVDNAAAYQLLELGLNFCTDSLFISIVIILCASMHPGTDVRCPSLI